MSRDADATAAARAGGDAGSAERTERPERAEHRWPAIAAVAVALVLYAMLPSDFTPWFRYFVVGLCVLLIIPLIVLNPLRLNRETQWSKWLSTGLAVLLTVANEVALVELVILLVHADSDKDGTLLLAATQVWATHVIAYALLYWEIDRGGPVVRATAARQDIPLADIRFPQDEDRDAVHEVAIGSSVHSGWTAGFVDYLYFSLSNTMAFSPPDAMPLTVRMKLLVGSQALAAFVVLVLVIARAVALLG